MFETVFAALAALGGGALIMAGFAQWLGKLWASKLIQQEKHELDLETESYRMKLKKSSFIFEKEYEAISELLALIGSYLPNYQTPFMDWGDVCADLAGDLEKIEMDIANLVSRHGAIVNKEALRHLHMASAQAGASKFEVDGSGPSDSAIAATEQVLDHLLKARDILLEKFHSQSSA